MHLLSKLHLTARRGLAACAVLILLAAPACNSRDEAQEQADRARTAGNGGSAPEYRHLAQDVERKGPPLPRPPRTPAEEALQEDLERLGRNFEGETGIAVNDMQADWTAHLNGTEYFPQQSVSKLWVAIAALELVDRGALDLSDEVTVTREDLTVFHQPIRPLALQPGGYTTTLKGLLDRAITRSDNTANDFLMWQIGGPDAVRRILEAKGVTGIRFGPGERALQSEIAGMEWRPEYSIERAFFEARNEVSQEVRREAFEDYLADPVDGATPIAIVRALSMLQEGELLSSASTDLLLDTLERTRSGPRRLKGGLPPGWSIGHKTGTGPELGRAQAGYNDVGMLTSPSGQSYSVAVLIRRTAQPLRERMELMQDVVRSVADYEQAKERAAPPE